MNDELSKQKELKLLPILINFNELIKAKGRLFVLDIIEYINKVNQCNSIESLSLLKLELGSPTQYNSGVISNSNSHTTTIGGIFTYIDRKISKAYVKSLSNDVLDLDDLEIAICKDIVNLKLGLSLNHNDLKPLIEKVIERTEVL